MPGTAVRVEEVSKRYRLGSSVQTYGRLSEVLSDRLRRPFSRGRRADPEMLWALSEVSFDVDAGQVIGLIGPNGAGKSTLLKILTRITSPTSGRVLIAGRVGSLLEVGTGFHPELSGRENVYLNGALLGLGRTEIDRRFDEIVEFAEVARFIDTPVKRFSSGMYVRLAFAVAAHLECDVLLVDEVLAVGDAAFQKKSLGKMGDIRSQGRTVILVSHNMSAITSICQRALLLQRGRLIEDGPAVAVARTYQSSLGAERSSYVSLEHRENRYGPRAVSRLMSVELRDASGRPVSAVPMGSGLTVVIRIRFFEPMRGPEVGFKIVSSNGASLATVVSAWENHEVPVEAGDYEYEVQVPELDFIPGSYSLSLWVKQVPRGPSDDGIDGAVEFEILEADLEGRSPYFDLYSEPGETWLPSRWMTRKASTIREDG